VLARRAHWHAITLIRTPPLSFFVDSLFQTLIDEIAFEMQNRMDMPTLAIAISILEYFLDSTVQNRQLISLPIDEKMIQDISELVLKRKVIGSVVKHTTEKHEDNDELTLIGPIHPLPLSHSRKLRLIPCHSISTSTAGWHSLVLFSSQLFS
jgi:hypothetical protein